MERPPAHDKITTWGHFKRTIKHEFRFRYANNCEQKACQRASLKVKGLGPFRFEQFQHYLPPLAPITRLSLWPYFSAAVMQVWKMLTMMSCRRWSNFLEGPGQTQGVLAHFRPEVATPPALAAFAGPEEYAGCLECCNSLRGGRHVSALSYKLAAVGDQSLCVLLVQLVLSSARQSDVALGAPRTLTLGVNAARYALSVLLDAAALNFLDVLNNIQVDAVRIVDEAVESDMVTTLAPSGSLLASVDCNVAGTGDCNSLALERRVPLYASISFM